MVSPTTWLTTFGNPAVMPVRRRVGAGGVSFRVEANERLVGSLVFKTSGGTRVPRRVRFPSASATPLGSDYTVQARTIPAATGYRGNMTDGYPDDPSHLVVSGLVNAPKDYELEHLRNLGDRRDGSMEVVISLREVIESAGPATSATHVTAVSADGSYTASIPLPDALAKGELLVGEMPGEAAPIRLQVPGGLTLCWNVKGLGRLRVTSGPEPDSLPAILTH